MLIVISYIILSDNVHFLKTLVGNDTSSPRLLWLSSGIHFMGVHITIGDHTVTTGWHHNYNIVYQNCLGSHIWRHLTDEEGWGPYKWWETFWWMLSTGGGTHILARNLQKCGINCDSLQLSYLKMHIKLMTKQEVPPTTDNGLHSDKNTENKCPLN